MGEKNYYKIDGRIISTPDKNLSPEAKAEEEAQVAEFMQELSEAGKDTIYGELYKTDEQKVLIKRFNDYIKEEAEALGVNNLRSPLPIKKIHFALPYGYHKQFPHSPPTAAGHQEPFVDAIYIKKNNEANRLQAGHIILHEMIHAYSSTRYDFDSEGDLNAYKGGYHSVRGKNRPENFSSEATVEDDVEVSELFRGFNEAITDLIAKEIMVKHQAELNQDLKISPEEEKELPLSFYNHCVAVEWIMDKISWNNREDKSVIWNKFKLGLFTGQIMHLREIEKTLGTGALRLVANMGSSKEANLALKEFMADYDKNK